MFKHLNLSPVNPQSVFILGGTGFVGKYLINKLHSLGVSIVSPSSQKLNLLDESCVEALSKQFTPSTQLVFLSVINPDKGKTADVLVNNLQMAHYVSKALDQSPVLQVIYMSANGVYEDHQNPFNEALLPTPQTLYGLMHVGRELIMKTVCKSKNIALMILRPCAIYGSGDTHQFYGPTRLLRTAQLEKRITLFGQGEEIRDHVYVEDVAKIVELCLVHKTEGLLNVASGDPRSFMDIANIIIEKLRTEICILSVPRSGIVTHRPIDISNLRKAFPSAGRTLLGNGIERMIVEDN